MPSIKAVQGREILDSRGNPTVEADVLLDDIDVTFPVLFDPEGDVSELYDVSAMPTTVIIDRDVQVQLVAAQRVDALGAMRGGLEFMKMPRIARVVEDELTVEVAQFLALTYVDGVHANSLCAFDIAVTSWSTSASVLYRPSDARAVPGMPKNCMTGIAQWWPVRMATPW